MEYRKLPNGNERISIIGLGSSYIAEEGEENAARTARYAYEKGINYFDLATSSALTFPAYGKALSDVRKDIYYQIHFGADYSSGEYGWTQDIEKIRRSVDWQLESLRTDYIDFGFIHCIDEEKDLRAFIDNGTLALVEKLKNEGIIKHIGLSTHTPSIGKAVLNMHIIDMMMFSINPCYDYSKGEFAHGSNGERMQLYRHAEKERVGISVMKPFDGGQLLSDKTSPFGKAFTKYQLLQYALDKPGVITVLPGARNKKEIDELLGFFDSSAEERDYSALSTFIPLEAEGRCVYCNHCQPCPAGLDIALINKYYDLAFAGDEMAKEHYLTLDRKASECLQCGHCDSRCPFKVKQSARMNEIERYFGE